MMKAAGLHEEQRSRIASKSIDSADLLSLLTFSPSSKTCNYLPPASVHDPQGLPTESPSDKISEPDVLRNITEDVDQFFSVRNLEEGAHFFDKVRPSYHSHLIDSLVAKAVLSKPADVRLVSDLLALVVSKNLCSSAALEKGFTSPSEDLCIYAPKPFTNLGLMMKAAGLDDAQRGRIALKLVD